MKRELTLPSGRKINWHRPPRHIFWKHGQAALVFQDTVSAMFERLAAGATEGEDLDRRIAEESARLYSEMTDEQREKTQAYVDDVVM